MHNQLYRTTYRVVALIIASCFLLTSCNEDEFLDRVPPNRYTPSSFFETPEQIAQATITLYPLMRGLHTGALFQYGEFRSDNTTFEYDLNDRGRSGTEEIDYFLLNPSSGLHGSIWNPLYTGIARANYVISEIEDVTYTNEAERQARLGEARFARGYFYYLLALHFGDVIIVTEPIADDGSSLIGLQRSPLEQVYEQIIIPDLTFAAENLPDEWSRLEKGRANRPTAQMALAKAHFARRDYEAALPLLEAIINSGRYRLEPDYADVFSPGNSDSPEIIFAGQFDSGAGQGSGFMLGWLPDSGDDITMGPFINFGAFNIPTCSLLDSYEDGDRRFQHDYAVYPAAANVPPGGDRNLTYNTKYLVVPFPVQGGIDTDFPIFRYADVLLMRAEALVETRGGLPNEAFEAVNALRARAGLNFFFPGNPDEDFDISTTEDLRQAIRKERRLELAYEGQRSYDLRRYGTFVETMLAHGVEQKEKQFFLDDFPEAYTNIRELLAIPNTQVELYGYRQNPGWE